MTFSVRVHIAAVYNYDGDGPHKLSLRFGDVVTVMEECGGWYKGCLYYSPAQKVREAAMLNEHCCE